MASVRDLDIRQLKQLKGLKQAFEIGTPEQKKTSSLVADKIRAQAGIQAESEGQLSLSQLNKVIKERESDKGKSKRGVTGATTETTDVADLQRRLAQQQETAQIAGLQRARQTGLSALGAEQEALTPQFAQARSQQRTVSEQGAKRFSDFLAQRGLTSGGGAALGETQRLGALQGQLGGLQQQEQTALGDIARRRTGLESGFASDVEAARAGIQAQSLQNAIAQANQDRQFAAQQQAQQFGQQVQQAGLTGQFGGAPTLQSQQQQFGQQIDLAQFNEGLRQFDSQMDEKTRQFDVNQAFDVRQQTFNETQQSVDNAIRRGQLSVQQGNLLLQKKKFQADNDPNSLDNQLKQQKLEGTQATTGFTLPPLGQSSLSRLISQTQPQIQTQPTTDFRTNPDFAQDSSDLSRATPEQKAVFLQQLQANQQLFVSRYGQDGYNELLRQAQ